LTKIKTVDGASSGLDADLLDGQQGSYYLDYNNFSNTPTIPTNNNQLTNGAGYITNSGGTEAATASTVAKRDSSGDINARLFRSSYGNQSTISGAIAYRVNTSDNYIRFCSDGAAIRSFIGAGTSNFDGAYSSLSGRPTLGGGTPYVDLATGNYGTVKVDDDRGVTWAGYAIRDDWVFMSNDASNVGIYNDTDNEWAVLIRRNAEVELYHNGNLKMETTSAGVSVSGSLTASGNVTAYSDERLKSDVQTLDGSKVYEMRGVSFTKDGEAGSGVIAQELQKVAPELVHDSGEYLSVAYGNLVGYLIEAIKELNAKVESLEGQLNGNN